MVAVAVLLIAVIGTSNFRYFATMDARKADLHTTAARIGLILTESWRGTRGDQAYSPVAHLASNLEISQSKTTVLEQPLDFTLLGSYTVVLEEVNYYTSLSWKDIKPGLRALNIVVAWAQRDMGGDSSEKLDKSFKLTTYTQTF
jgi:hypothetical protein